MGRSAAMEEGEKHPIRRKPGLRLVAEEKKVRAETPGPRLREPELDVELEKV